MRETVNYCMRPLNSPHVEIHLNKCKSLPIGFVRCINNVTVPPTSRLLILGRVHDCSASNGSHLFFELDEAALRDLDVLVTRSLKVIHDRKLFIEIAHLMNVEMVLPRNARLGTEFDDVQLLSH
jgi:hypothetical protein